MTFDDVMEKALGMAIACVVGGTLSLVGYASFETLRSDGEADYCYVEMWSPGNMAPQYQLHTHRPWRFDRIIGNFPTLEEAAKESDRMRCPMGKR